MIIVFFGKKRGCKGSLEKSNETTYIHRRRNFFCSGTSHARDSPLRDNIKRTNILKILLNFTAYSSLKKNVKIIVKGREKIIETEIRQTSKLKYKDFRWRGIKYMETLWRSWTNESAKIKKKKKKRKKNNVRMGFSNFPGKMLSKLHAICHNHM